MKNQDVRKIILIVLAIIIIIGIVLSISFNKKNVEIVEDEKNTKEYFTVLEDGTKLNNSNKLNENKIVEQYKLSNIQLTYSMGKTVLLADVENIGSERTELKEITINLLDKEQNTIKKLPGVIKELNPGEITQLNIGITIDCVNAYDLIMEL